MYEVILPGAPSFAVAHVRLMVGVAQLGEPEDEIHPANEFPGKRPHRMCGPVIIGN
ncbi:MAG: hypothetical protein BMS9Abin15_0757 [Gammaproteobacteria bacterium]|nr:MAG: hypothetical protein BMS9Abin15_0757 [Gammaproteobacteria bacterium]